MNRFRPLRIAFRNSFAIYEYSHQAKVNSQYNKTMSPLFFFDHFAKNICVRHTGNNTVCI